MIVLKTSKEVSKMRKACAISAQALEYGGQLVKEGVTTAYIDKKIRQFITSKGATPSFLGYGGFPGSACISVNDEIIHGIPGPRKLQNGDIVSIDVGAHIDGYHGDNAATFPVGEISEENKLLINVTRDSFYEALKFCKVGYRLGDIGNAVESYIKQYGFSVVRDYVGHGVGKNLHEDPEVPNYGVSGHGIRLAAGMTIAIEPMINAVGAGIRVLDNDWTVVTKSGSNAAHYENTVYITDGEPVILTTP